MTPIRTTSTSLIEQLKQKNIVLCIGVFDGVHIGHRFLIENTKSLAFELSAECAVYTFWPYPRHVYDQAQKMMIYSLERKYEVLEKLGVKHIIEQSFDPNFSKLTSENFVRHLLAQVPLLRGICVGADFRFGHGREGTISTLASLCTHYGIIFKPVDNLLASGEIVSSTRIRHLISIQNLSSAKSLLGEKFLNL